MDYYAWTGKEEGQLRFLIQEVYIQENSPFKQGEWIVHTGMVLYTNEPYNIPENEHEVEIAGDRIFDNLEDALQATISGVFNA
jgi:hypothetical protein